MTDRPRGDMHDGELLNLVAGADGQDAFAELVLRHRDFVYRICRRVSGDAEEAEDATQQVFLVLSKKAGELTDRTSIAGWLYRTAWQVSLRTRRAINTRRTHERAASRFEPVDQSAVGHEVEMLESIRAMIDQLPETCQEAIVLHYFSGYTVAEAAARMRCPSGTVASRISRGLQMIRQKMTDRGLVVTVISIKVLLLAEAKIARAVVVRGGPPRIAPRWPRVLIRPRGILRSGSATKPALAAASGMCLFIPSLAVVGRWFQTSPIGQGGTSGGILLPFLKRLSLTAKIATAVAAAVLAASTAVAAVKLVPTINSVASDDSTDPTDDYSSPTGPERRHRTVPVPSPRQETQFHTSYSNEPNSGGGGGGGGATAIPEPPVAAVIMAGGAVLARRRRNS